MPQKQGEGERVSLKTQNKHFVLLPLPLILVLFRLLLLFLLLFHPLLLFLLPLLILLHQTGAVTDFTVCFKTARGDELATHNTRRQSVRCYFLSTLFALTPAQSHLLLCVLLFDILSQFDRFWIIARKNTASLCFSIVLSLCVSFQYSMSQNKRSGVVVFVQSTTNTIVEIISRLSQSNNVAKTMQVRSPVNKSEAIIHKHIHKQTTVFTESYSRGKVFHQYHMGANTPTIHQWR